mmetsp:Transcript_22418/g.60608  ORF Transcript_22418/g.60608 Transcript_22418/m.60608 type:complete len:177 (-) Transcript_22418:330-860(-)
MHRLMRLSLALACCAHVLPMSQAKPQLAIVQKPCVHERARGGFADLAQPAVPKHASYSEDQLGQLHVLWFRARRATLKGIAFGLWCFLALGGTPPSTSVLGQASSWMLARIFVAVIAGLVARAVDWKVAVAVALFPAPFAPGLFAARSAVGQWIAYASDLSNWPGGYIHTHRDLVL